MQTLNDARARLDDVDRLQQCVEYKGALLLPLTAVLAQPQSQMCVFVLPHSLFISDKEIYQRPGLERLFRGLKAPADLILKRVSRLDAFSGYLFHT